MFGLSVPYLSDCLKRLTYPKWFTCLNTIWLTTALASVSRLKFRDTAWVGERTTNLIIETFYTDQMNCFVVQYRRRVGRNGGRTTVFPVSYRTRLLCFVDCPMAMAFLSSPLFSSLKTFHEHLSTTFWVILLTDRRTNQPTDQQNIQENPPCRRYPNQGR